MAGKTYGGGDFVTPPVVPVGSDVDTNSILSLSGGLRQRIDCFRFDVVDHTGSIIGDVHPMRSSNPGAVGATSAVEVTNDTTRTEFRTMTNFNLDANEATQINPASDWVRPALTLQNGATFPLGVFLFSDDTKPTRSWGSEVSATLADQMYILDQEIGRNISVNAGVNCVSRATQLAAEVIKSPMLVTPSSSTVTAALGWNLSTTRLQIMIDLLNLASYYPPYFDNLGRMVLRPVVHPPFSSALPPYEAGTRIVKDSQIVADDLMRAPNRYVVYDSSANNRVIVGTFDIPASAPNSYANRQFYVVKSVSMQGLESVSQAQAAAMSQYHTDPDQYRTIEFDSTADPRHDTFDVVQYLGEQYLETGWALELRSGGRMKHRLRRLYES